MKDNYTIITDCDAMHVFTVDAKNDPVQLVFKEPLTRLKSGKTTYLNFTRINFKEVVKRKDGVVKLLMEIEHGGKKRSNCSVQIMSEDKI